MIKKQVSYNLILLLKQAQNQINNDIFYLCG
ncbi:MAG: hypothetical protein BWY24_00593 [Microgenomates group bacterium ADurb.Bin219]|nr:MAG: hypothetical protein BWY24_00593 [Microgenomates group bacterium ADurb.Bin219]